VKRAFRETPSSTSVYKPAAAHYNCGKSFIVIYGYSPSVEGVGSQVGVWRIPPLEPFYSEAMVLRECFRRAASSPA
jgi:hypothetical protein